MAMSIEPIAADNDWLLYPSHNAAQQIMEMPEVPGESPGERLEKITKIIDHHLRLAFEQHSFEV